MKDEVIDQHTHKKRHGGPYDRGSADRYYRRAFNPHFYMIGVYGTLTVKRSAMTGSELADYARGYAEEQDRKEYG